jgi:hypothetical protein
MAGAVSRGCAPATLANAFVRIRVNDGERQQKLLERAANGCLITLRRVGFARARHLAAISCHYPRNSPPYPFEGLFPAGTIAFLRGRRAATRSPPTSRGPSERGPEFLFSGRVSRRQIPRASGRSYCHWEPRQRLHASGMPHGPERPAPGTVARSASIWCPPSRTRAYCSQNSTLGVSAVQVR